MHVPSHLVGRPRHSSLQSFSNIGPLLPQKRQYHLKEGTLQLGVKHRREALSFEHTLHASYIWRTIKFIINGKCTFYYQNSLPYILSILAIFQARLARQFCMHFLFKFLHYIECMNNNLVAKNYRISVWDITRNLETLRGILETP